MRVLVTGAAGQLGSELLATLAADGHEAIGVTHRGSDGTTALDIMNPASVEDAVAGRGLDAVVNCAAWTGVDAAETNVDAAYAVNTIGPRLLATHCARAGVLLMHVSTDFVFGASPEGTPVDEWTAPSPLSVYGRSKLAGEDEVRRLHGEHQIVRTSWLYGRHGPNFVMTMLRLARERPSLRVVADQFGSPTWTGHLAPAMVRLLERGIPGTYHLSNSGHTSWHGLAEATLAGAGLEVPVTAIATADWPAPAPRPSWSVLDNRAWRLLGHASLPPWEAGLSAYLSHLRREQAGEPAPGS